MNINMKKARIWLFPWSVWRSWQITGTQGKFQGLPNWNRSPYQEPSWIFEGYLCRQRFFTCLLACSLLSETEYSSLKWCWFMCKRNLLRHISLVQWTRQVGKWHFIRLSKAQLKAHGVCRHQMSPAELALPCVVIGRETYRKRYVLQDMILLWSSNWPKVRSALPARCCSG